MRNTRIRPVNPERIKRLRAQQFGTDGKREWILGLASALSGKRGWGGDPMTPAHVGRTRASGAGPEMMAPLLWTEHVDFDSSITDQRFEARHGVSRARIREIAVELEAEWQRMKGELAE